MVNASTLQVVSGANAHPVTNWLPIDARAKVKLTSVSFGFTCSVASATKVLRWMNPGEIVRISTNARTRKFASTETVSTHKAVTSVSVHHIMN